MKKCATPHCHRKTLGKYCFCCHQRNYRKNHPMRAAYQALKDNAKRRGKEFNLSFDEFSLFCRRTHYLTGKGKTKESYSIDRKKNHLGYTLDNIHILTLSQNTIKKIYVDYDYESKIMIYREPVQVRVAVPF